MAILKIFTGVRTVDAPKNDAHNEKLYYRVEDVIKNIKNFTTDDEAISYWKKIKRDYTRRGGTPGLSFICEQKKRMDGRLIEYASILNILKIIQSLPEPDICGIQTILADCGYRVFKEINQKVVDIDECLSMMLSGSKNQSIISSGFSIPDSNFDIVLAEKCPNLKEWEVTGIKNTLNGWKTKFKDELDLAPKINLFAMLEKLVETSAINFIHDRESSTFEDVKKDCKDASNLALAYMSDYSMVL